MAHKKQRRKKTLPLLLAALTLAGAGLWWGNYTLSVEEYAFSSSRLPPGWDGGRLVVLSDLHGRRFGRDNSRLAAAVEAAHPDVIALVGDFVDEWTDPAYLRPLLERLTALAPCYFVSGNHEWAAGKMQETAALLVDCGVTWLHNGFVTLQRGGDSLLLAGIDDPNGYADQKTPQQVAREVRDAAPEGFWLLLAHRNNLFESEYAALGADLTLSGHGHGGPDGDAQRLGGRHRHPQHQRKIDALARRALESAAHPAPARALLARQHQRAMRGPGQCQSLGRLVAAVQPLVDINRCGVLAHGVGAERVPAQQPVAPAGGSFQRVPLRCEGGSRLVDGRPAHPQRLGQLLAGDVAPLRTRKCLQQGLFCGNCHGGGPPCVI